MKCTIFSLVVLLNTMISAGVMVQNSDVPFVKTIAAVITDSGGKISEYKLPFEMPSLLGAGAEFIPQRLTAASRSPYEATIALESWLRATGGFGYTEDPPAPPEGVPPLVDFATPDAKRGTASTTRGRWRSCSGCSGSRPGSRSGSPAAAGTDGEWVVTDHQAHAWVEAWFAGYGWLPFDPTPGRGALTADYTLASDSADAVRALGTGRFLQPDAVPTRARSP